MRDGLAYRQSAHGSHPALQSFEPIVKEEKMRHLSSGQINAINSTTECKARPGPGRHLLVLVRVQPYAECYQPSHRLRI